MRALLNEVRVLEHMLATSKIESGIRRIGAEQEMFIVDRAFGPACKASEILLAIDDPRFTHELGLFNLEANLSPRELKGDCLRRMERNWRSVAARKVLRKHWIVTSPGQHTSRPRLENLELDSWSRWNDTGRSTMPCGRCVARTSVLLSTV
jgi:hypothetical protein